MAGTLQRIKEFIDYKGLSIRTFEKVVGFSNGALASQIRNDKTIGVDKVENILQEYPELSETWLLKGEGPMLRTQVNIPKKPSIPEPNAIAIDIPQPGDEHELELIRKVDSTEFRRIDDELYMVICPLVTEYAYAGYCASWSDAAYIDELPKHAVMMRNLTFGDYRAFVVRGDSMDNGLKGAISSGDIVTGRKLYEKYWHHRMHIHKYKHFILVTDEGIMIKEILEHKVEQGIIVCHSLNSDKVTYPDFELSLAKVKEIYYVKARTEPLD